MHRKLKALLLAATLLASPAAAAPGDCGTIVIPTGLGASAGADITSLNPLLVTSLYNQQAAGMMFQPLVWINGNTEQIDWSRSLASAISTPDSGTTYNVTLRPWHWSDGVPVTTADVAYTFSLIKKFGTTYAAYGAGGMPDIVKALNIISPTQFQVVLKHQVNPNWYIFNGLGQFMPLPKHAWEKYNTDQIFQEQSDTSFFQVVDGPLLPQKLEIGLDLIMVPNLRWEGPKLHFNRLIVKFVEVDGQTVQQVESGDLDMANVPMGLWNAVQNLPGIYMVNLPPALDFNEIMLNFRNPKVTFFNDVRVRQAMADAINQAEMVALIDHGHGTEIYGPVPPVPPTYLTPAMQAGHYPVSYDPAKAVALLQEAGYSRGPDGIMQKDGKKLSFTYLNLTGDVVIDQITMMNQAYLKRVGIEMKVRDIEFNQMLALLNNPQADWEAAGLSDDDPGYPTGEELFKTGSFLNSGGYSDPTMDKLIDESTDQPGQQGLYDYETYASAQQPVLFQEEESISILARNNIHGVQNFIDPAYNYYPDQLYCSGEAKQ